MSSMLWGVRERLVLWANSSVGMQFCLNPLRHPAVLFVPTRLWYVRVLDSKGAVDKLDEVPKMYGMQNVVVIVVVDPPADAASRSAFEDAGSGCAENVR